MIKSMWGKKKEDSYIALINLESLESFTFSMSTLTPSPRYYTKTLFDSEPPVGSIPSLP